MKRIGAVEPCDPDSATTLRFGQQ